MDRGRDINAAMRDGGTEGGRRGGCGGTRGKEPADGEWTDRGTRKGWAGDGRREGGAGTDRGQEAAGHHHGSGKAGGGGEAGAHRAPLLGQRRIRAPTEALGPGVRAPGSTQTWGFPEMPAAQNVGRSRAGRKGGREAGGAATPDTARPLAPPNTGRRDAHCTCGWLGPSTPGDPRESQHLSELGSRARSPPPAPHKPAARSRRDARGFRVPGCPLCAR